MAVAPAENLEARQLLAGFGNAWADPRSLSISFPSENTPIGAKNNEIRTTFDAIAPRLEWQTAILRAAQAWSEHANLNIGLVPDRGDAFGAVGLSSNDPRFGELRVGAFAQAGVLASAVANLPISGTWGGDILFDSDTPWYLVNSNSQHGSTGSSAASRADAVDLYTIALHELGNALSLSDVASGSSVMSASYTGAKSGLTATDIAAIQAVYGVRQDPFELSSNNTSTTAAPLVFSSEASAAGRLQVSGSLVSQTDVDVYSFQPLAGRTSATVTLWAAGVSLLEGELEVRSRKRTRLGLGRAESIFRNNVRLSLNGLESGETYYVTVRRSNNTAFAVGDYRVDLDFRSADQLSSVIPRPHDADPYTVKRRVVNEDAAAIDAVFSSVLLDTETTANNTLGTATALNTAPGYSQNSRYEAVGSLSSRTDLDFYTITAPSAVSGVLNVNVAPLGTTPVNAELFVMNLAGDRLAAKMVKNSDGSLQVQVSDPVASETYLVCIRTAPNATVGTGNYVLTADFATDSASMTTVLESSVAPNEQKAVLLTSNKSQLFRIDLVAAAGSSDQGLQLKIYDAATGEQVKALGVVADSSGSLFVWLPAGEYYMVVTGITRNSGTTGALGFSLKADVISDDEGPGPDDGTGGGESTTEEDPFTTTVLPEPDPGIDPGVPSEDPWNTSVVIECFSQYLWVQLLF